MHAVVINVSFADFEAAKGELGELVPRVSSAPGFVAGYWIALSPNEGTSVVVFDSEDSAQTLLGTMAGAPAMAVSVDSVSVGEVIAHA
jgi:hypothetical protein